MRMHRHIPPMCSLPGGCYRVGIRWRMWLVGFGFSGLWFGCNLKLTVTQDSVAQKRIRRKMQCVIKYFRVVHAVQMSVFEWNTEDMGENTAQQYQDFLKISRCRSFRGILAE